MLEIHAPISDRGKIDVAFEVGGGPRAEGRAPYRASVGTVWPLALGAYPLR